MEDSSPKHEVNSVDDSTQVEKPVTPKKPIKPPKIEDKPFNEFITNHSEIS